MPRQDKLTRKFEIWVGNKLVALIDAEDMQMAQLWADKRYSAHYVRRQGDLNGIQS